LGEHKVDTQIQNFLDDGKAKKLKEKLKGVNDEASINIIKNDLEEEFSFEKWLPDAAMRAKQLSIVSHPGKFSNPNADISSIFVIARNESDGFLRSGNADVESDALGTAALDVYKFLNIVMHDGRTILKHLEEPTEFIKSALHLESQNFDIIRRQLLEIKKNDDKVISSDVVKQVYFPVQEAYHLLSILTPSGLVFGIKDRIRNMKFSDSANGAKQSKKKNEHYAGGFDDIYNLSMIGYGGSNPQNISALNSKKNGEAYLLESLPPRLNLQYKSLPSLNFFTQAVWPKKYVDSFKSLHKLLDADVNNIHIRQGRDNIIQFVADDIIKEVWLIRAAPAGWSANERYASLPKYQKVILDKVMDEVRAENEKSIDEFIQEMARWFINAYKKILGNEALPFHDDELRHIQKIMENSRDNLL